VKITQLHVMLFSPLPCYLVFLGPNTLEAIDGYFYRNGYLQSTVFQFYRSAPFRRTLANDRVHNDINMLTIILILPIHIGTGYQSVADDVRYL
jgi:hypothetical protein